ncbi:MAG: archaellin/type IV pilin N-terminal domain-containing protein [Thermoplasmatota archaeon]
MKANRKARMLTDDEEAVSPVIGVILMVAITVVLAAVVFVLVSDLGSDSETGAAMKFQKDESDDQIKVVSAENTIDWDRISLKASATGSTYDVNDAAATGDTAVTASLAAIPDTDSIEAGDYIEFCGTAGAITTDTTYTLVDNAANQVLAEMTFDSLAACA